MNILHLVESYWPAPGGMSEVTRRLSEGLVAKGHTVTIATGAHVQRLSDECRGVKIIEFELTGNMACGICGDQLQYRKFLLDSCFDIVTAFAAQQWSTDVYLQVVDKVKGKKVFVPTGFSGLFDPRYYQYYVDMPNFMRCFDATVLTSFQYRDAIFAKQHNISPCFLIPNGAALEEFSRTNTSSFRDKFNISKDCFIVLHVGSHTGLKGHREAIEIFAKSDVRNSVLVMIGNGKSGCFYDCLQETRRLNSGNRFVCMEKKVILLDLTREETISAFMAANVFLFPSAIECSPIVLFECMASRTPFLVTDVGNSKEIVSWSGGGLVLPTLKCNLPDENTSMARLLTKKLFDICGLGFKGSPLDGYVRPDIRKSAVILSELFRNQNSLAVMAEKAHSAWLQKFTWEKIINEYEILYLRLLKDAQ